MTEDLDIYRSAHLYIREHGDDAAIEAAKMIDTMLDKGDLGGQRVWRRVLKAIDVLQTKERPAGTVVN